MEKDLVQAQQFFSGSLDAVVYGYLAGFSDPELVGDLVVVQKNHNFFVNDNCPGFLFYLNSQLGLDSQLDLKFEPSDDYELMQDGIIHGKEWFETKQGRYFQSQRKRRISYNKMVALADEDASKHVRSRVKKLIFKEDSDYLNENVGKCDRFESQYNLLASKKDEFVKLKSDYDSFVDVFDRCKKRDVSVPVVIDFSNNPLHFSVFVPSGFESYVGGVLRGSVSSTYDINGLPGEEVASVSGHNLDFVGYHCLSLQYKHKEDSKKQLGHFQDFARDFNISLLEDPVFRAAGAVPDVTILMKLK